MEHLRPPLVRASLAFMAGALLGLRFGLLMPGGVLFALALVGVTAAILGGDAVVRLARAAAPFLVIGVIGYAHGAVRRADAAADCRASLPDGAAVILRGVLTASHVPASDSAKHGATLALRAEPFRVAGASCGGEVRVRLPRDFPAAAAGTTLHVQGAWWRYPSPVLRGAWPTSMAPGFVMAREVAVVEPVRAGRTPVLWARGRTQAAVLRLFPRHAPLADALLLNRRERLDPDTRRRFADSGLVHLLAISGAHVALIGGALVLLARAAGCSRRATAWITVMLIAGYLALIGAPASAVRAGGMLSLVLVGRVLQRPSSVISSMAAAALALVAIDPLALLDPGFQLSFAGVGGLALLRPAILRRIPGPWKRAGWSRGLLDSMVSSVAAFATTGPIVAFHFGQCAPISILANLPAVPLTSLGLAGIAAAVLLEPVAGPVARLLAEGAGLALDLLDAVATRAAAVPGGHFPVARPSLPLWLVAGTALALALRLSARIRAPLRWALAAGSVWAVLLLAPLGAAAGGGGLELAFLDVGQGDAFALRTPAGRWVLVDAGPLQDRYDAGERRVLPYLRARGATRVEALVLTHPHADHIGGAPAVLRGIPVGSVVDPGMPFPSPVYAEVLRAVQETGSRWVAARQDRILRIDGVELAILWPTAGSLDGPEDANDISAVVHIRYGAFRALLTGDAPAWVERDLVARYGASLRSQVLKAGHHGSRTSTSDAFLEAVRPELVVVSSGRRNRYGHPAPEVMRRLRDAGIPVARTDADGTVLLRVESGGEEWEWRAP